MDASTSAVALSCKKVTVQVTMTTAYSTTPRYRFTRCVVSMLRAVGAGRVSARAAGNEASSGAPVSQVAKAAGEQQQQHELVSELRARDPAQGKRAGEARTVRRPHGVYTEPTLSAHAGAP